MKLDFDMQQVFKTFWKNVTLHAQSAKIFAHRGLSSTLLSSLLYKGASTYDFIYLDGSHTQRDTLIDLTLSMLLIKKGGIIIIDDYLNRMATDDPLLRPKDAVDFVVKSFGNEVDFSLTPQKQAVIIRK